MDALLVAVFQSLLLGTFHALKRPPHPFRNNGTARGPRLTDGRRNLCHTSHCVEIIILYTPKPLAWRSDPPRRSHLGIRPGSEIDMTTHISDRDCHLPTADAECDLVMAHSARCRSAFHS